MSVIGHFLRLAAVWAALAASQVAAALLVEPLLGLPAPPPTDEGGLTAGQAFLVVTTGHAIIIAWIAARSRWSRAGRFATLLAIVLGVQIVMAQSETLFFGAAFDFAALNLPAVAAMSVLAALATAATAALVYPARPADSARPAPAAAGARGWAARLAAAAALYVAAYLLAGTLIAWTSPEVRAFYGDGPGFVEAGARAQLELAAFQLVRGLAWAALVLIVLASHGGSRVERVLAATVVVSAYFALPLLYPNPVMPEAVRYRHLVEVGVSMAAWGAAASILLAPLVRRGRAS